MIFKYPHYRTLTGQVFDDRLAIQRLKRLLPAIATLHLWFMTEHLAPYIVTGQGINVSTLCIAPSQRVAFITPPE